MQQRDWGRRQLEQLIEMGLLPSHFFLGLFSLRIFPLQMTIETRVFEGIRGLGGEHFQNFTPGWREDVGGQAILEIQRPGQMRLLYKGQTQNGTGMLALNILVL